MSSVVQKASSNVRAAVSQRALTFDKLKTALFFYVVWTNSLKLYRHLCARGIASTLTDVYKWVAQKVILLVLRMPKMKKKVETEMAKAKIDIESKLVPQGPNVIRHLSLPSQGKTSDWITQEMQRMDEEMGNEVDWRSGKLSGAVYHGGPDMEQIIVAAFQRYCVSNPLHPDVFPAVRKMEAEIVAMCLRMYNNPDGAGTTTSGGTESIVMAVKTHREWARLEKGITEPEMVVPESAHAAFDKAADYFKIKFHSIPVDPVTRQVDLKRVKRAINANTIMLVGSAVNFPDGNMDPIPELGALAKKHNIGLHVDCCLGSFIVPFLDEAGFSEFPDFTGTGGRKKVPLFDFRVPGVTSISCDTHKYGFAPKGSSVVMYRNAELRRHQYYLNPEWMGGVYASPSLAGSRPGSLIAGTWAAMQYMGRDGYLASCKSIVSCARKIGQAITDSIPELYVLGNPPASVVAFASRSPQVNVLEVGDKMRQKGWHLNGLMRPAAVHIACTRLTVPIVDQFIADLKDSVNEAKLSPSGQGSMVAVYGLGTSSAVGPKMVSRLATAFLDALYKA
ncbi:PLP-dependent transferase [Gloeophyllum trabeum ATCC 11539]|uniref:sphinganine-1-phosphate aldolase n=1 Tax=Gloeophyllum trabeum (strain ATCC 11539 / FP-39264 / Madison 617) TaxID=670483 RepID=S7QCP2_GLOTA|nr:PLP-dependent transferase [Gloeophyllum trabeum ATCC 11539]EPQ57117.1 PLP-dependent transferase [Gloeophyllum trabeum ATCC 11539]